MLAASTAAAGVSSLGQIGLANAVSLIRSNTAPCDEQRQKQRIADQNLARWRSAANQCLTQIGKHDDDRVKKLGHHHHERGG